MYTVQLHVLKSTLCKLLKQVARSTGTGGDSVEYR
jgi:hypothetical protein